MPLPRLLPALLAVFLGTVLSTRAQVIINEIHYHPVELEAFNADGTPVIDLSEDVHEFVEIRNTAASTVDISGWKLTDGINFTFPASTTIAAGGYKVIARKRDAPSDGLRHQAGCSVPTRGAEQWRRHCEAEGWNGVTVDSVSYDSQFPWPTAPTPSRRTTTSSASPSRPINTKAVRFSASARRREATIRELARFSAIPRANPGQRQRRHAGRAAPVVVAFTVVQASDESPVIRASQPVEVTVTFSSTARSAMCSSNGGSITLSPSSSRARPSRMNAIGNGQYVTSTNIPGQIDRSVVRWRIKADRGAGLENVSPRADDMAIVPVTASTKEAWHAYFVEPVRSSTRTIYDFFISTANDSQLNTNCSQSPRRVQTPDPPGYPRDEPFDGYYPPNNNYNPVNYPAAGQTEVGRPRSRRLRQRRHRPRHHVPLPRQPYQRSQAKNSWKFFFPSSG
jgi:hypothetical protein